MTPTLRWLRQENYHVSKVSLACIARSHLKQNEETKKANKIRQREGNRNKGVDTHGIHSAYV